MKKVFLLTVLIAALGAFYIFAADGHVHEAGAENAHEEAHHDEHGHAKQANEFTEKLEAFRDNKSPGILFGVISLVFLYGLLHGLSLAHGGSVISAWVLASKQKLSNVVIASALTGFFHALSATLVVFTTWFILKGILPADKLQSYVKIIAAVAIIATGVSMIYNFITAKIKGTCTHCHEHGHEKEGMNPVLMAALAGMMPCPVTSVILITSLGLGMALHGLLFMFVFALGMASAIMAIAAVIWFMKERAEGLKLQNISRAIENVLPVLGALLFISIGIFLLVSGSH